MRSAVLNDKNLRRFWFNTRRGAGLGVTAYSLGDARAILEEQSLTSGVEIIGVIEDVDVAQLDQGHVIPNMGPPNFRGVWFPNLLR